jgi:hypothetical protein
MGNVLKLDKMNLNYKQLCIDKIINWTIDSANEYHNNTAFPVGKKNNKSLFEDTANYYCTWRDSNCVIVDKETAKVYKLCTQHMYYKNDWEKYVALHTIGCITGVRTDVPLHHEFLEYFNPHANNLETWEYSIVQRPNAELGRFFIEDVLSGSITDDYFIQFVDDSFILLHAIKQVNDIFNSGVPSNVSIFRRIHDSVGPFWIDCKRWKYSYEQQHARFIKMISLNIDAVQSNALSKVNKDIILNYANTKLKPLFN